MENLKTTHYQNWRVFTGCTLLGPGCDGCPSYWEAKQNNHGFNLKSHPELFDLPLNQITPQLFKVALGSDPFHEEATIDDLKKIFQTMFECPQHTFEIVTKRAERALSIAHNFKWPRNILFGVSVENRDYISRLEFLRAHPAKIKFVQFLPLLGPVGEVDFSGIHVVAVQPETWGDKRPAQSNWIKEIFKQCEDQGVLFTLNNKTVYEPEVI